MSLSIPTSAAAQERIGLRAGRFNRPSTDPGRSTAAAATGPFSPVNLQRAAAALRLADRPGPQNPRPKRHAIGWGIAVGIGAGVGLAAVGAAQYGENEPGTFCSRCFVEWSAVAIPIGAGVGAAVGYVIDRARR